MLEGPSLFKETLLQGEGSECRGNTPLNFISGFIFFKVVATTKPGNDSVILGAFYPAGNHPSFMND